MLMRKLHKESFNEQGFASIVIALMLILVLALLTIGFAQLARREQQTALDKQLANQAYYAAESGVNDAIQDINSGVICSNLIDAVTCPVSTASATNCMKPATGLTSNPQVNPSASAGVAYTCLLVNLTPANMKFDDVPPNSDQYLNFSATQPLSELTITWQSHDNQNTFWPTVPSSSEFKPQASWSTLRKKRPPVVLFSLTPSGNAGVSRSQLVTQTFNLFLYPASTTGSYATAPGFPHSSAVGMLTQQGQVVPGDCGTDTTNPTSCSVTITGLGGQKNFLMYFTDYYDALNLQVSGTDTSGAPETFIGQDQIDVTGQAHNVLKRIQVALTANSKNGTIGTAPVLPGAAIEAQNLCKRIQVQPTDPSQNLQSTYYDLNDNPIHEPSNNICDLSE